MMSASSLNSEVLPSLSNFWPVIRSCAKVGAGDTARSVGTISASPVRPRMTTSAGRWSFWLHERRPIQWIWL